jgi:hypothetical protein
MNMTYQVFILNPDEGVRMARIIKMLEGDEELGKHTHTEFCQINDEECYQTYVVVCTKRILRVINEYVGLKPTN